MALAANDQRDQLARAPIPTGSGVCISLRATTLETFIKTKPRLFLTLTLLALLSRLPGFFHQLFDPDEATIAVQAQTLREGGRLYSDVIDRKPPLAPLLYWACSMLGRGVLDLRVVHLAVAVLIAVSAIAISQYKSLSNRSGFFAGTFLIAGVAQFLPDNSQAANYSHIALLPGVATIVLAKRGTTSSRYLTGVALAVAVASRQTWLIGVLPAAFAILSHRRRFADFFPFAGTFLLSLVLIGLPFAANRPAHWIFTGNSGFLASPPDFSLTVTSLLGNVSLLLLLHVGMVFLLWNARRGVGLSVAKRHADLVLWTLTGCVAWASGVRFFGHYSIQALAPLAIVAALALDLVKPQVKAASLALTAITAGLCVGWAFFPTAVRTVPNPTALATYINAYSTPSDRVLMWGNYPEVLWKTDRQPAGAFVTADLVTGLSGNRKAGPSTWKSADPAAMDTFASNISAHSPRLVIDTSTANLRQYGAYPISEVPFLKSLLAQCFNKVATIDAATVYARKSLGKCQRAAWLQDLAATSGSRAQ